MLLIVRGSRAKEANTIHIFRGIYNIHRAIQLSQHALTSISLAPTHRRNPAFATHPASKPPCTMQPTLSASPLAQAPLTASPLYRNPPLPQPTLSASPLAQPPPLQAPLHLQPTLSATHLAQAALRTTLLRPRAPHTSRRGEGRRLSSALNAHHLSSALNAHHSPPLLLNAHHSPPLMYYQLPHPPSACQPQTTPTAYRRPF